jgi:hypothetical protein
MMLMLVFLIILSKTFTAVSSSVLIRDSEINQILHHGHAQIKPKYIVSDDQRHLFFNEFYQNGVYRNDMIAGETSALLNRVEAVDESKGSFLRSYHIEKSISKNPREENPREENPLSNNTGDLALHSDRKHLFIADTDKHQIFLIDTMSNKILPYAGNHNRGYSGDGGPALEASICGPIGLALDSTDNLFISESCNYIIRRVDALSRIIVTFISNGYNGLFSFPINEVISATQFYGPRAMEIDQTDRLYVVHETSIIRLDPASGQTQTILSCEQPSIDGYSLSNQYSLVTHGNYSKCVPIHDIAIDSSNNLVFLDEVDGSLWKIHGDTQSLSKLDIQEKLGNFAVSSGILMTIDKLTLAARQVDLRRFLSTDLANHEFKARFRLSASATQIAYIGNHLTYMALDPSGNLYASVTGQEGWIWKMSKFHFISSFFCADLITC